MYSLLVAWPPLAGIMVHKRPAGIIVNKRPAARNTTVQEEYTLLRKRFKRREALEDEAAAEVLRKVDASESLVGKVKLLKAAGGGRKQAKPKYAAEVTFQPSVGFSVRDRIGVKDLRAVCVRKGMLTKGKACQRTLAIHGHLRAKGFESVAPLPCLYKTEVQGGYTYLWQQFVGADAMKTDVDIKDFKRAVKEAVDQLEACGLDPSTLPVNEKKNWALVKEHSKGFRAVLLDVGEAKLKQ